MSTVWDDKTIAINPLIENDTLLGTAIVSKNQKYFYAADVDIERLVAKAKHIITFDGYKSYYNLNFRALYYQIKPTIKFQSLADIIKQEYYTTNTEGTVYFSKPDKAKQSIVEAMFMLQFFLKHYKNKNKSIYELDKKLIRFCKEYHPEIQINQTLLRTNLSMIQKQQWDTERILFNVVGYPIVSIAQVQDKELQKRVENYLGQIQKYKQNFDELIDYLDISELKIDFDVTSTATGRILCRDRSNSLGLISPDKKFRELFVAKKNHIFLSADYKRQEANILAVVSEDEQLKNDLQNDNFYKELAKKTIKKEEKSIGKILFYAVIYGAKPETVANELNIKISLANEAINKIKKQYPDLNYWLKNFNENTNYFGRRLHTNTVNAYIQSTAADILRDRLIATCQFNPVLVLSDNIIYQVKDIDIKNQIEIINNLLQKTLPFNLKVSLKAYYNLSFRKSINFC